MGRKLDAMRAAVGAKPTPVKKEPGPVATSTSPTPVDIPLIDELPMPSGAAVPLIDLPPAPKEKRQTSNIPRLPNGSRFEMVFTLTGPEQGYWDGTLTVPNPDEAAADNHLAG